MIHTVMNLGGIELHYGLRYEQTLSWFRWHMHLTDEKSLYLIKITDEQFKERSRIFALDASDSFKEYGILAGPTALELCKHSAFIFHSVAFSMNGYAWLLTAPSGTGKTTQYRNLKRFYPEEVKMICGDMPVLKEEKNGDIYVYPSPWNGKERIGFKNHQSFPVGGIIFLEQADHNRIEPADFRDLILPLWDQFVIIPETTAQVRVLEQFANHLLGRYPVWKYKNKGDNDSARVLNNLLKNCPPLLAR